MSEPNPPPEPLALPTPDLGDTQAVQPSWRPLLILVGILWILLEFAEALFEFLLEMLELFGKGIFFAVEGSEELLEDKVEEWLDLDPYHAEMLTAWTTTPLKLLAALLILRWLWKLARAKLFPRIAAFAQRQILAVRLAWDVLAWSYRILLAVGILGVLIILI